MGNKGGQGNDLEAFSLTFPRKFSRLVQEDLSKVINENSNYRKPLTEAIKCMERKLRT